jgi:hypothetical protein
LSFLHAEKQKQMKKQTRSTVPDKPLNAPRHVMGEEKEMARMKTKSSQIA